MPPLRVRLIIAAAVAIYCTTTGCAGLQLGMSTGSGVGVGVGVGAPMGNVPATQLRDLGDRINGYRTRHGARALAWDDRLAAVARRHSEDMARRGYFAHVDPDGHDPFARLDAAGIRWRAAAENIAEGQRTTREVYDGWIESTPHRENIERREYTHYGLGVYRYRWTLLLARYRD